MLVQCIQLLVTILPSVHLSADTFALVCAIIIVVLPASSRAHHRLAAEWAEREDLSRRSCSGPGSLRVGLLDQLHLLNEVSRKQIGVATVCVVGASCLLALVRRYPADVSTVLMCAG